MKKLALGLSLLVSLGVSMIGCGDSTSSGCQSGQVSCDGDCIPEADSSLDWVQTNVFDVHSCAASSCHDGQNVDPQEDLDLRTTQMSYDTLVDIESQQTAPQLLVAPNDSNTSYLIDKLLGRNLAEGTALMPFGAVTPLCTAKIDGVRAWIDAGANP